MSLTYRARHVPSSFDVNVSGAQFLGLLHVELDLPIFPPYDDSPTRRVPYEARMRSTRSWAVTIREVYDHKEKPPLSAEMARCVASARDGYELIARWASFLATCGGYKVDD